MIAEVWAEFEKKVEDGRVKSIGVSNFTPQKIQKLLETAKIRPANNQVRRNGWAALDSADAQ